MKFSNSIDTVKKMGARLGMILYALMLAIFCFAPSAFGQVGIDVYAPVRSIVFTSPSVVTAAAISTNGPIDLFGYTGRGFLDIFSLTNGGGTLIATVQSSADQTNWTTLTSCALINSTTQYLYTNQFYGSTNLIGTNNYLLPGTITAQGAGNSSNAFAGSFLLPTGVQQFTNSAAVTITAKGVYRLAWDPRSETGRYYQIYYTTTGGTATNNVGSVWTGIRSSEVQ